MYTYMYIKYREWSKTNLSFRKTYTCTYEREFKAIIYKNIQNVLAIFCISSESVLSR